MLKVMVKFFECKLRGILKKTNNKYNCVVGDRVEISEDNSIVEIFKRDLTYCHTASLLVWKMCAP